MFLPQLSHTFSIHSHTCYLDLCLYKLEHLARSLEIAHFIMGHTLYLIFSWSYWDLNLVINTEVDSGGGGWSSGESALCCITTTSGKAIIMFAMQSESPQREVTRPIMLWVNRPISLGVRSPLTLWLRNHLCWRCGSQFFWSQCPQLHQDLPTQPHPNS